jgi:hypothetical protein
MTSLTSRSTRAIPLLTSPPPKTFARWTSPSRLLARFTSQYGDVYLLATDSSVDHSSAETFTSCGIFLGIRGRAPDTSLLGCVSEPASKIRHRIDEQGYLVSALELEVGTARALYPASATQNRRRGAFPNTEHEHPEGRDASPA